MLVPSIEGVLGNFIATWRSAADYSNGRVRLLDNNSVMSSLFFPGNPGLVVNDGRGGLLIGDAGVRVRRAVKNAVGSYVVSTIAGNGSAGWSGDSGFATSARLYQPFAVTPDGSGGVYVADNFNCVGAY